MAFLSMGPLQATLSSVCANSTWNPDMIGTAYGFLLQGGPPPGASTLNIFACQTPSPGSEGIQINVPNVTSTGTFADGTMVFTDPMGVMWFSMGTNFTVTKLGPVGDTIEGFFDGMFYASGKPLAMKGQFQVCHGPNEEAP
jgi:hypothetical protein